MSDVKSLVLKYGTASLVLDRNEAEQCFRVSEVVKRALWEKADHFVSEHRQAALLYSYTSDGTPMTTKSRFVHRVGEGRVVKREGGALHEFLVQRAFVKVVFADGSTDARVLLCDPLPLDDGKTAWHLYSAGVNFYPMLREKGHVGIAVSHYGFDRALFTPLEKRMRMRHAAHYAAADSSGECPSPLLELTDWVVATGCGNHDCQNALKWGVKEMMDDPEALLKDLYVVMEACRNGYAAIHDHLRVWLLSVVRFKETRFRRQDSAEYWQALGVDPDMVEELCQLNPVWLDGELCVSPEAQEQDCVMERLTGVMLYLFRFRKFTESRWTTLGAASRGLVCAMSVGLVGLMAYVRAMPGVSDWHLHGFARLVDEGKHFVCVCGLAAAVPDSILVALLKDDRVAGRVSMLDDLMREEFTRLADLPTPFWARLETLCAATGPELRADAMRVATIAGGYIDKKLLRVARDWPWRLADGDVEANLEELASQDEVLEPVTAKIKQLLHWRFNRQALVAGVQLLAEVHWTTTGVEQGHGSAATMHRLHGGFGAKQLCARAFLHMARLLFADDAEAALQRRAEDRVAALKRKCPGRVSGQNMFLRDMFLQAKANLLAGDTLSHEDCTSLLAKHSAMYDRMSKAARGVYETAAAAHAAKRADDIDEEIVKLQAQEVERQAGLSRSRVQQGVLMRLSHCKFSCEDIARMDKRLASADLRGRALEQAREAATRPPEPPALAEQVKLQSFADKCLAPETTARAPLWARMVCHHRDDFRNCILRFQGPERSQYFLFVYAVKNPELVVLAPLREVIAAMPCFVGLPLAHVWLAQKLHVRRRFAFNFGRFTLHNEVVIEGETQLHVLPHVHFTRRGHVGTDGDEVPWADFTEGFQVRVATETRAAASDLSAHPDAAVLLAHPWLQGHFDQVKGGNTAKVGARPSGGGRPRDDTQGELDDDAAEHAFAELEKKRREWEAAPVPHMPDFVTKIRGGAWTAARTGSATDSVRGEARGQDAIAWCVSRGVPKTATFAFTRYTEGGAGVLAREWCRRMQWYFDAAREGSVGHSSGSASSSASPGAPPPEPEEFANLMTSAAVASATRERGAALRAMRLGLP